MKPLARDPNRGFPLPLQALKRLRTIGTVNFPLAESARLMPDTASPLPALESAYAGLIS